MSDARKYPPICVTRFERGAHKIFYINAEHVTNANNATCQTIYEAFNRYHPQSVVVELGGDAAGSQFEPYVAWLTKNVRSLEKTTIEPNYTILRAVSDGIHVVNGEPTDAVVFREIVARGTSPKVYQAHQLLQWLGQAVRHKQITPSSFDAFSHSIMAQHAQATNIRREDRLSVEGYKRWFAQEYPNRRSWLDVSSSDTAPENASGATVAQRLSYDIDRTREPHIVQTITNMLNAHKSVLVVYGAGHREAHLPVFEHMLGESKKDFLVPLDPICIRTRTPKPQNALG